MTGEWKTIDTAPTGKKVRLGKLAFGFDDKQRWDTSAGIAFESKIFGLSRKRTYYSEEYTHWMPLPEPPLPSPPNTGDAA